MIKNAGADHLAAEGTLGVDGDTGMEPAQAGGTEDMLTGVTGVGGEVDVQTDGAGVAVNICHYTWCCSSL